MWSCLPRRPTSSPRACPRVLPRTDPRLRRSKAVQQAGHRVDPRVAPEEVTPEPVAPGQVLQGAAVLARAPGDPQADDPVEPQADDPVEPQADDPVEPQADDPVEPSPVPVPGVVRAALHPAALVQVRQQVKAASDPRNPN